MTADKPQPATVEAAARDLLRHLAVADAVVGGLTVDVINAAEVLDRALSAPPAAIPAPGGGEASSGVAVMKCREPGCSITSPHYHENDRGRQWAGVDAAPPLSSEAQLREVLQRIVTECRRAEAALAIVESALAAPPPAGRVLATVTGTITGTRPHSMLTAIKLDNPCDMPNEPQFPSWPGSRNAAGRKVVVEVREKEPGK